MKTKSSVVVCLFMIGLFSGCGGDYSIVSVSGTVTMDGKPEAGIQVAFGPKPVGDNLSPGPYSLGVTDENGEFELESRYGNRGAIVGPHRVTFAYLKGDEMEQKIAMAKGRFDEATNKGNSAAADKAEEEYEKLKEAMARSRSMPSRYTGREGIEFEVTSGGHDDVKFELTSDPAAN